MTMARMEAEEVSPQRPKAAPPPAGEVYFVTLTTADGPWLAVPRTRDVFLTVLRAWHAERNGRILAAVALPDHAHVLVELGSLLTISQVVASWKAAVRRGAGYAQTFDNNVREYRLEASESVEDYGLYMFLSPYRARLLLTVQAWDGWWTPEPGLFQFPAALNAMGGPPEEWVNWPASRFRGLAGGK